MSEESGEGDQNYPFTDPTIPLSVPLDEEITNAHRANRAASTLDHYTRIMGEEVGDFTFFSLTIDLLTDLHHLARKYNADWATIQGYAGGAYDIEQSREQG